MRSLIRIAVLAAVALSSVACVTSSDVEKLQSQISDLQEQLAQVKRTASNKEEVNNINRTIAEQTQTLLKSNATLVAKVDQIEEKIQSAQGGTEQTNYRLDRMTQQLTQTQHDVDELKAAAARAAAAPQAVAPMPASGGEMTVQPPAAPSEDPMQTYQSAYRDYQQGHYDLAVAGFRDFAAKNPNSELSGNAAYWIGESLYSQKKYREAIQQFDSVVTKYPRSDKVAGALLKKGYAYIALNEKSQGIVQLQYVVHEHPTSPEAALARQKLKSLGVDSK
ncbi:MAG: tol-pal system protein YbgF [Acidobacteria bacterium]|nr:tol-pal system protein YbgF [Acidobacteriota bacterium]MBV9184729.1 tol-pal system protein YbgF [Acidobacteriota bacterium]